MKRRAERLLEPHELKLPSMRKLCMKVAIMLILIVLVGSYLYVTIVENLEVYRERAWFSCDPEIDRSIVHELSVKNPVTFCWFRYSMAVISVILLLPFLLEAITLTFILVDALLSDNEKEYLYNGVGLVDGKLVLGKSYYVDNRIFALPLWGILCMAICLFWVLIIPSMVAFALILLETAFRHLLLCCKRKNNVTADKNALRESTIRRKKKDEYFLETILLFMSIPEIILAYLTLATSFLLVLNSQTPEDVLVNIVAVQIFSQLDEIIVRILLNPEVSLGMSVSSVVGDNPDFVPIPVYKLSRSHRPHVVTNEL